MGGEVRSLSLLNARQPAVPSRLSGITGATGMAITKLLGVTSVTIHQALRPPHLALRVSAPPSAPQQTDLLVLEDSEEVGVGGEEVIGACKSISPYAPY
jgi:hypothetical protein